MPIKPKLDKAALARARKKANPKKRQLTPKQARFVDNFTSDNPEMRLNGMASYKEAYSTDNVNVAKANAYHNLRNPNIASAIVQKMREKGITEDFQVQTLKELMEAERPIFHNGMRIAEVPDHEIRHKALVTSFKVDKTLEAAKENGTTNNTLNINISPEQAERMLQIAKEMRELRSGVA